MVNIIFGGSSAPSCPRSIKLHNRDVNSVFRHPVECWYFLTLTEKSASARKYRCSTSPRSTQGIVFSMRNEGVMVVELFHAVEQEIG